VPPPPEAASLLASPTFPSDEELDRFVSSHDLQAWRCELQFYGDPEVIAAQIRYARRKLGTIPGAQFTEGELMRFPLSQEQLDRVRRVAVGIPNMAIFSIGARSTSNPSPNDGHLWFAPVIPKTGEAVLEAQRVFVEAFRRLGAQPLVSPFTAPATWPPRTFIFIMGFPVYRNNADVNRRTREVFSELIRVAADHGWGEYRTPPAFQDAVMATYSYNNHALLRLHETIRMRWTRTGFLPRADRESGHSTCAEAVDDLLTGRPRDARRLPAGALPCRAGTCASRPGRSCRRAGARGV
jgi:(+)-pinoresinol hydroxylase